MGIESHLPTELLRPFIKTILIIESEEEMINRVLPDTSIVMAFRFKGQVDYIQQNNIDPLAMSVISGLRRSVRLINYFKNTGTILILFKEGGASAFFKSPMHELFDASISLDNFISQQKLIIIEEQLAEATNNHKRVAIIEQVLVSILHDTVADPLIVSATNKIHSVKGVVKIKQLAETLSISQDAFEKRFRRIVGTTPKQFASIIRMKHVITQQNVPKKLTDLAFDAGYFDQAHFNTNFKVFTGLTPTEFFKSPTFW